MNAYRVKVIFRTEMLGTASLNAELYQDFIASKAPEEVDTDDELATISAEELTEKGTTGFRRLEDGTPCLVDYMLKGFFKSAAKHLRRETDSRSSKMTAYRQRIDGNLFVFPRFIPILGPYQDAGPELEVVVRPLRASTAQGERIALARSEIVPAGSELEFSILTFGGIAKADLDEWFAYGMVNGLGAWRNAGHGCFFYEMTEVFDDDKAGVVRGLADAGKLLGFAGRH